MDAGCVAWRATSDAGGEGAWSWHPWAGVKPRDDDLEATVTNRSWTPGRARYKSKTIAQGMSLFGLYLW
jgi:hypothetical protein